MNDCVELNFQQELVLRKLDIFGRELQRKRSTTLLKDDHEMFYLCNRVWLEKTALAFLAAALQFGFTNRYEQLCCLSLIDKVKLSKQFATATPDFNQIYRIVQCLFQSNCDIKLDLSIVCHTQAFNAEVLSCLNKLVELKFYECATKIARLTGVRADFIITSEWRNKFERERQYSVNFWLNCNQTFESSEIEPVCAVKFFETCADITDNNSEKYEILKLAHKWASRNYLSNKYDIEKRMWLVYFSLNRKIVSFEDRGWRPPKMLFTQIKENLEILQKNNGNATDLSDEEISHLDRTIEKLLDVGDVWQALRLSNMFQRHNEDLDVIILCYSLAEGMLSPYELTAKHRLLVNRTESVKGYRKRRPILSRRLSTSSCK